MKASNVSEIGFKNDILIFFVESNVHQSCFTRKRSFQERVKINRFTQGFRDGNFNLFESALFGEECVKRVVRDDYIFHKNST